MSGFEDEKCAPQIRIYLLSEAALPGASLSAAIAEYETVVPRSKAEAAFIRKMAVQSEEEFRREVARLAARGRAQFEIGMQRTGRAPTFVEMVGR